MNDAGRIGFVTRGKYDSSATYEFLDVVLFGNSSYVAKKSTTGNEPEENNEYWQLLAKAPETKITLADIGILSGTSAPVNSQGSNDNLYIQY